MMSGIGRSRVIDRTPRAEGGDDTLAREKFPFSHHNAELLNLKAAKAAMCQGRRRRRLGEGGGK